MNSIELMSSMSTRSGTLRPRIAVASLVTYCASRTGVSSTVSRSWDALNFFTRSVRPVCVAARHHTCTVPVASCPNPAAWTSGSGRTELQPGTAPAAVAAAASAEELPPGEHDQALGSQTRMAPISRLAQA